MYKNICIKEVWYHNMILQFVLLFKNTSSLNNLQNCKISSPKYNLFQFPYYLIVNLFPIAML